MGLNMIEKTFVLLVFLLCVGLILNLFTGGAFFRQLNKTWHQVRDWSAARRRRAYMANEIRTSRMRGQVKSRSMLDH